MRATRLSLKRSLLLSSLLAISFLSAAASAQGNNPPPAPSPSTGGDETSSSRNGGNTATTGRSSSGNPVITPTGSSSSPTATSAPPRITGGSSAPGGRPTGLPTLSRTADLSIPTYPPPAVPPTQKAPFMQHSTLPEGTVFICVGAILGAFGVAILVWRAIVVCLLHRSVERAYLEQHHANDKAAFPAPPAPFYKYSDRDSSPNLMANAGRGSRRTTRGPTPSATPSQSNLFFSPTASGAGGMGSAANRDSRFLPSGFYAAGAASPANGHGHSISLTNLRPDSRGNARTVGHSPPDSPSFGPRTTPVPRNISSSSVNLNRPPSGRAPSAFLDDLLDDQPHLFPGAAPSPHHHSSYSHSSQGRY